MSPTKCFGNDPVIMNVIVTPVPSNCSVLQNTQWTKLPVPLNQTQFFADKKSYHSKLPADTTVLLVWYSTKTTTQKNENFKVGLK
jgi:hypothetical protein